MMPARPPAAAWREPSATAYSLPAIPPSPSATACAVIVASGGGAGATAANARACRRARVGAAAPRAAKPAVGAAEARARREASPGGTDRAPSRSGVRSTWLSARGDLATRDATAAGEPRAPGEAASRRSPFLYSGLYGPQDASDVQVAV